MDDADFLYVKGPGVRRLVPNSAMGWRQFALALAGTLALALLPLIVVHRYPHAPIVGAVLGVAVMLAFLRSATARAKVIDLRSMGSEWAEFQAWRKRRDRP